MTLALFFWIIFIVVTLFRVWRHTQPPAGSTPMLDYELPYWLLVLVLGVGVFGWPIK